jgi:hypothetical protein
MKRKFITHGLFIFCYLGIMAMMGVDFSRLYIQLTVVLPCVIIFIADVILWWRSSKKTGSVD